MTRALLGLLLLAPSATAAGQTVPAADRPTPWIAGVAHRAKWITGAGAVVLTALAAREHDRSNDQWHTLLRLCRANHAECVLDAAGRYENAAAEDLYQAALQYDRRARTRLLGGQAALLLTAALVLIDLRHGNDGPPNIPFDPLEVTPDLRARGVRVGLRLTF